MFLVPPKSHATEDHCPGNDADVRSDVGFLKRSTTGSGTKGILSQKTKPKMKTRAPKEVRRPRLDPTVLRKALRGLASVVAHAGNSEINLSQIWQCWPGVWTSAPHQGQVMDTGGMVCSSTTLLMKRESLICLFYLSLCLTFISLTMLN